MKFRSICVSVLAIAFWLGATGCSDEVGMGLASSGVVLSTDRVVYRPGDVVTVIVQNSSNREESLANCGFGLEFFAGTSTWRPLGGSAIRGCEYSTFLVGVSKTVKVTYALPGSLVPGTYRLVNDTWRARTGAFSVAVPAS